MSLSFGISQKRRQTCILELRQQHAAIPSRIMITARDSVWGSGGLNLATAAAMAEERVLITLTCKVASNWEPKRVSSSLTSRMREEFFFCMMSDCAPDRFFFIASSTEIWCFAHWFSVLMLMQREVICTCFPNDLHSLGKTSSCPDV